MTERTPAGDAGQREEAESQSLIVDEIQILLSEKRTALSVMRTGIAVLALPLAVFGLLVATSRYYSAQDSRLLFVTLIVLSLALVGLGSYLVLHSLRRIHHFDGLIQRIRDEHPGIRRLLD